MPTAQRLASPPLFKESELQPPPTVTPRHLPEFTPDLDTSRATPTRIPRPGNIKSSPSILSHTPLTVFAPQSVVARLSRGDRMRVQHSHAVRRIPRFASAVPVWG